MATTIITKYGSGAPAASDVVRGELAVDTENGRLYTEDSGGSVVEIGLNPSGNVDVTGTVTADGANIDGAVTTGDITIDNDDTPTLNFKKDSSADILGTINVSTDAGSGGKMVFQTKRNGNTALDRMIIDDDGDISFYEDTGTTAKLFWDASAESLGIGTSSPSSILHLLGTDPKITLGVSGAAERAFLQYDNTASLLSLDSDGAIRFSPNNTEAVRIDTSGNVGISTDSPQKTLDVQGTFAISNSTTSYWDFDRDDSDGSLKIADTGTERLRIDASGDLLLGNSNNTFNSTGRRCLEITGSDNSLFALSDTQPGSLTYRYYIHNDRGNGYINHFAASNFKMLWWTGGARRMTLDENGNLLVGTAAVADLTNNAFTFDKNTGRVTICSTGVTEPLIVNRHAGDGTLMEIRRSNSVVGTISVTASATAYNTSSDQRLKENIVDAPSASDDIDAIQVRSFDWKADGTHQRYGMIAQELLESAPEVVHQPEDPEEMMGVDYSKLVPMMLKEIQQLRARVAQLEGAN